MAIKPTVTTAQLNRVDDAAHGAQMDDETNGVQTDELSETSMGDQAVAIAGTANTDAITDLIKAIGSEMDSNKAQLAVSLLNVTSTAVRLQGRTEWTARDFLSYGVALAALSHID